MSQQRLLFITVCVLLLLLANFTSEATVTVTIYGARICAERGPLQSDDEEIDFGFWAEVWRDPVPWCVLGCVHDGGDLVWSGGENGRVKSGSGSQYDPAIIGYKGVGEMTVGVAVRPLTMGPCDPFWPYGHVGDHNGAFASSTVRIYQVSNIGGPASVERGTNATFGVIPRGTAGDVTYNWSSSGNCAVVVHVPPRSVLERYHGRLFDKHPVRCLGSLPL